MHDRSADADRAVLRASLGAVKFGPRLARSFFDRPCPEVARDLIGTILVVDAPDGAVLAGRLVEVEAYRGEGLDPASHAHAGRTQRNRSMFEAPGNLYVYRCYGIHSCVNLVCEARGSGAAVLLRSVEPLSGIETMRRFRGLEAARGPDTPGVLRKLASGPGRLAQAFGLNLEHDGASVLRGPMAVRAPGAASGSGGRPRIACGRRVGISRGEELAYRFYDADSPLVSSWRAGRSSRRA